ncbi:ArsR/SmtB family transcription factor [Knoellia subterranea]|uniref:ArsR family transcriptional regulator n=1 Tax=Knoellia subterranea KCTC 19937 TaxID=1385521 RepID=A0A0A0JK26_9MICO|nr:metalloregulator ArsR/SmtB family transcription factor [Knoellia subterranea]KGN37780.1 ArsR family transcriptional regulator [Knoellia subterranea KCTC 19937]
MDVFAALSDPVRRDLLRRLATGPARVVDLTADHGISRPAISRHLRVLSEADLVHVDDVGRERHYRLNRAGLAPLTTYVTSLDRGPRFDESVLDGLDLEVRRTVRERRSTKTKTRTTNTTSTSTEESA